MLKARRAGDIGAGPFARGDARQMRQPKQPKKARATGAAPLNPWSSRRSAARRSGKKGLQAGNHGGAASQIGRGCQANGGYSETGGESQPISGSARSMSRSIADAQANCRMVIRKRWPPPAASGRRDRRYRPRSGAGSAADTASASSPVSGAPASRVAPEAPW